MREREEEGEVGRWVTLATQATKLIIIVGLRGRA